MRSTAYLIAAMLTCLSACNRGGPTPASRQGSPAAPATTTKSSTQHDAEVRFGVSPTRNSQVTYQPGVIIMEHGAEAIRSESSDGFTWTIDAKAPGAAQIERDKILFATGRMVGRVLLVKREGDELAVTLGPVELTDLIAEAHIDYKGPIDPTTMIVYVAASGYPGSFLKDPPQKDAPDADATDSPSANRMGGSPQVYTVSRSGDLVPFQPQSTRIQGIRKFDAGPQQPRLIATSYLASDWTNQGFRSSALQRSWDGPIGARYVNSGGSSSIGGAMAGVTKELLDGFSFLPSFHDGLQLEVPFQKDGLTFSAKAKMKFTNPEFKFKLDITHGLKTAAIELSGVGGIDVEIAGGTDGKFKNVHENFYIPVDYSIPIPAAIPFSAIFRQSMRIDTVITWNHAVISSAGSYSLGGTITAGIVNGAATGTAPIFVKTNYGMADSLKGLSIGVNGLVVGWGGKFIVGLGKFGFVVGPYASVNVAAGITQGSALQGGGACRASELDLTMKYGMGFAVPAWTVAALNQALEFFGFTRLKADYEAELGTLSIKQASDGVPPKCASNAP
ncbi:MAG: hypothetical protein ABJC66_05505 [Gammaproteobacteria bacterium]